MKTIIQLRITTTDKVSKQCTYKQTSYKENQTEIAGAKVRYRR